MLARTWKYGTQKTGVVLAIDRGLRSEGMLFESDDDGEAFVMLQKPTEFQEGDRGVITFMKGGPTGGYWEFKRS